MKQNHIQENVGSKTSLTPMVKSLRNIENMLRAKGYRKSTDCFVTGQTGGLVKMDVKPVKRMARHLESTGT